MTNQTWRVVAAILAVILAVLGGATIAFVVAPGPGSTPTPPASFALASPSGSGSPVASLPTSSSSSAPSSIPAATASPGASAPPIQIAHLTITALKLDPRVPSTAGIARFFAFTSDGPGTVTAQLTAITPGGTTHMCLFAGSRQIKCGDAANGTLTATTTSAHVAWRVSLEGNGVATPTVELTVTFPSVAPLVMITHARFDGTDDPDTNGIQVIFVPRVAGTARIVANWAGPSVEYEIDATDQSSGSGGTTYQGSTTKPDQSIPVTAGDTWKVILKNTSARGKPDMTVTISWP